MVDNNMSKNIYSDSLNGGDMIKNDAYGIFLLI